MAALLMASVLLSIHSHESTDTIRRTILVLSNAAGLKASADLFCRTRALVNRLRSLVSLLNLSALLPSMRSYAC